MYMCNISLHTRYTECYVIHRFAFHDNCSGDAHNEQACECTGQLAGDTAELQHENTTVVKCGRVVSVKPETYALCRLAHYIIPVRMGLKPFRTNAPLPKLEHRMVRARQAPHEFCTRLRIKSAHQFMRQDERERAVHYHAALGTHLCSNMVQFHVASELVASDHSHEISLDVALPSSVCAQTCQSSGSA